MEKNRLKRRNHYSVGVVSDTHGRLRPAVLQTFEGTDLILHAGDIDHPDILAKLRKIAPLIAVRRNMDWGDWANDLRPTEAVQIGAVTIHLLHDLHRLSVDPHDTGFNVVISGHTHQPLARKKNGVLYLNPGSATAPRCGHKASVAVLQIRGGSFEAQFIWL
ncbi:MAG: metallophosphoesterase family protein [Desulfobacterales bacterium]|nr:MAG: metallophosphoesterase family protein [Desulfobacterales bacterium]